MEFHSKQNEIHFSRLQLKLQCVHPPESVRKSLFLYPAGKECLCVQIKVLMLLALEKHHMLCGGESVWWRYVLLYCMAALDSPAISSPQCQELPLSWLCHFVEGDSLGPAPLSCSYSKPKGSFHGMHLYFINKWTCSMAGRILWKVHCFWAVLCEEILRSRIDKDQQMFLTYPDI